MKICKRISSANVALLAVAAVFVTACADGSSSSSDSSTGTRTGTAGSTARMIIDGDFLYAISGETIQLFDITVPSTPVASNQVVLDDQIQTLFPYEDFLLVGAADGIRILDNTDRASPQFVADFQHAITRDPVVAQDDVAYATLQRDETQQNSTVVNQLNVIDISDPTNPVLAQAVELESPSGLSVSGNRLYVCDGEAGLRVFDLENKLAPVAVQVVNSIVCDDVIAADDILHIIGPNEYSQYNTSLAVRPQLMSTINREPIIVLVDR